MSKGKTRERQLQEEKKRARTFERKNMRAEERKIMDKMREMSERERRKSRSETKWEKVSDGREDARVREEAEGDVA